MSAFSATEDYNVLLVRLCPDPTDIVYYLLKIFVIHTGKKILGMITDVVSEFSVLVGIFETMTIDYNWAPTLEQVWKVFAHFCHKLFLCLVVVERVSEAFGMPSFVTDELLEIPCSFLFRVF